MQRSVSSAAPLHPFTSASELHSTRVYKLERTETRLLSAKTVLRPRLGRAANSEQHGSLFPPLPRQISLLPPSPAQLLRSTAGVSSAPHRLGHRRSNKELERTGFSVAPPRFDPARASTRVVSCGYESLAR